MKIRIAYRTRHADEVKRIQAVAGTTYMTVNREVTIHNVDAAKLKEIEELVKMRLVEVRERKEE